MAVKSLWNTEDGINVSIGAPTKNLSHIQTFEDTVVCNKNSTTLINTFDLITIQPNKKVSLDFNLPVRCDSLYWGGLYINLNIKINDTWYNLGNGGHEGSVMAYSAKTIDRYDRHFLFDFISVLGLPDDQPFTMQVELVGLSFDSNVEINGSHEINIDKSGKLTTRGEVHPILGKQNFSTLTIEEMDR